MEKILRLPGEWQLTAGRERPEIGGNGDAKRLQSSALFELDPAAHFMIEIKLRMLFRI